MVCPMSPLLFALGMEVLTCRVASDTEGLTLAWEDVVPSIRAFMEDLTIVSGNESQVDGGLQSGGASSLDSDEFQGQEEPVCAIEEVEGGCEDVWY